MRSFYNSTAQGPSTTFTVQTSQCPCRHCAVYIQFIRIPSFPIGKEWAKNILGACNQEERVLTLEKEKNDNTGPSVTDAAPQEITTHGNEHLKLDFSFAVDIKLYDMEHIMGLYSFPACC